MSFTATINSQGNFTASVNGSAVFNVSAPESAPMNVGMAVIGPTGLLTADAPLIYDGVLKNISIDLSDYATLAYVDSTFYPLTNPAGYITSADLSGYATESWVTSQGYITSAALAPYLLSSTAASTYQTISGMSSYLTIASAAATYQPIGDYATNSALTAGLALKLDKPAVAGLADQILSTDGVNNIWIDNFARTLSTVVRNETGTPLAKGTVVYISGASGNKPLVQKAIASTEMGSSRTFGILAQDIPNNQNGEAVAVGQLTKVNTFGLAEGVGLWLSPTTAGTWTTTKPTAPYHAVFLGNVVRAHQTQGVIEVRIQNGYELDELHDVAVLDRANNDVLVYESSTSLWKSKTIAEVLGYTPANNADLSNYYLASNPSGYITSAALSGYATESWVQSQGYLTAPYNPFDQSLNTTDSPQFVGLSISDSGNTGVFTQPNRLEFVSVSGLDGGVYALGANIAFSLQNPDTGVIVQMDLGGITFPDGTVQSTAWTGSYNPFDQSLNTTDSPQFQETTVGGLVISGIGSSGITFADLTVQTTAAVTPDLTPYAQKAATNTFTANQVISVTDNTNAALRVTQTGTGEAFRVEDSTNPDSSPFVITADGNVGVGRQPTAGYKFDVAGNFVIAGSQHSLLLASSGVQITQAGGSATTFTITNSGTGNSFRINDVSGDTTPFIVDADGNVGVKTASPAYDLDVNGTANLTTLRFADSTTQSTAAVFFDQSLNTNDDPSFSTITATDGGTLTIDGGGITFPDGTVQTTAASGNAFDQDLNTYDAVQFSELNITEAASPTTGVFISPDGTITVNDDNAGLDGGLYLNGANVTVSFNGDYQYKAYPFYGGVATAIEGGLLNANSPSATNAFATLGDVESSVNAYAASVTPVLPTTGEKAALSNANLPSASNPYLTLSGTPIASETQSGLVELANRSEALVPTSTTLAISPAQAATMTTRLGLKRVNINLQGGMSTQVTGTGGLFNQIAQYINFSAPNSGLTGFARGYTIMNTADPTHIASNAAWINFSKPEGFSVGIYLTNAASAAGIRVMGIWGETNSPTPNVAIGDPTNKRILFSHTVGGNILLMVHDGTSLYTVDSGLTPPTVGLRKYYIEVTWDGTGYAEMYVKDALGNESTVSTNNAPVGAPQTNLHSTFLLQSSAVGTHTSNPNHSPTHPSFFFA